MRIMMINDGLAKGGKERRLLELIKGLIKIDRFKITLVILTDLIDYDYVHDLPIELIIINRQYKKDLSVPFKLRKIINNSNPDIVHSWGTMASIYLAPILAFKKTVFINGIIADAPHGLTLMDKRFFRKKLTFPFSDVILANSMAGIEAYRPSRSKSICIYNGLDLDRFINLRSFEDLHQEILGENPGDLFIAGMVAAFEDRKDYDTVVKSAISLCRKNIKVRFILIGSGKNFDRIKKMVPEDLEKKVIFLGKRADVESVIQLFDVGLLITNSGVHGEGISNSIIEYMALGKPVIATTGGGTNEVVLDGVNGYLVEPFNPDQIVSLMEHLIKDKSLKNTMGNAGKEMVHENFSLAKMAESYVNLYDRLNKVK